MLRRLRALVRRFERDTEGRLRLELAATKAALRDALRDQARERAEGAAALRDAVRERDAWRARVPKALGGLALAQDQLGATVERIERLMSAYRGCRESERALQHGMEEIEGALMGRPNPPFSVVEDVVKMAHKMRERRDRWRARVAPSEDRVVALTKELRATQGRLRQAERQVERARAAAQAGPPWLSDAARALAQVAPDGTTLALNWTQVLEEIRRMVRARDAAWAKAEQASQALALTQGSRAQDRETEAATRHLWRLQKEELDAARAELAQEKQDHTLTAMRLERELAAARAELAQAKQDGQWLLQTLGLPATAEMAELRGAVQDLVRERDAARAELGETVKLDAGLANAARYFGLDPESAGMMAILKAAAGFPPAPALPAASLAPKDDRQAPAPTEEVSRA